MKHLFFCFVIAFSLFQPGYLPAQEAQGVQVEQLDLGPITGLPMKIATTPGAVIACGINLADASWTPRYIIDYAAGQTWYLEIMVANCSTTTKTFKIEYDLRCADGATYYVYRYATSIGGLRYAMFRVNVTSYVAKLGLMTLAGRVYGTGMGNDNRVTSQAFIY